MRNGRFAQRIEGLSETKKELLARCLEDHDLDASWLFEELPVPPRTPLEARMVEIWEQVLGIEDIGIEDNFFDLGGDSILSVRIVMRAREAGILVSSRQLFENPSIVRLAELAKTEIPKPDSAPAAEAAEIRSVPLAQLTPEDFPEAELTHEEAGRIRRLLATRPETARDAGSGELAAAASGSELSRILALRAARF